MDVEEIVADVEDQPTTRRAVGVLVDRLAQGYLQAIAGPDGGAAFAETVAARSMDLCDAVIRIGETPSGMATVTAIGTCRRRER